MKSIKMFVVAFIAIFLACSFCSNMMAQSNDGFVNQFVETCLKQNESELHKAGIISLHTELNGTVFVCTLLLDEAVAGVDMIGSVIDVAKEKHKTAKLFSEEESKVIQDFESQGLSCRCIVRGNNTGTEIARELSVREFLAFEKYLAGDKAFGGEPSIDDIVSVIDKALAKEEGKMGCVRREDVVYLEHEMSASEYDDIKSAMENCGWLIKKMMKKARSRDKKVLESFRAITKQGYRFAYSVKCGNNEPVIIELDL